MKFTSAISQVWIDLAAHEKLWAWTRLAKGEVSMLGLVEDGQGGPAITDLFLMRQTCTAASTDMDQADIARLLVDLGAAGLDGRLRAWVHSHASMDVFWSRTDDDCIEGLGGDPYIVSVVVNRRGDVRARVDVFRPVRFTVDDVPVKLRVPGLGLEEQCRSEFEQKVREAPVFPGLTLSRFQGPQDLFPDLPEPRRQFAFLDLDAMEAAVHRGEMTDQEYLEATEGDGFVDPFVDAGEPGEVNDGRRA